MARASNVYVVTKVFCDHSELIAAFTVKHELATWLYRRYDRDVCVTRMEDSPVGGDASKLTEMEVAPLVEQGYKQDLYWWNRSLPEFRGECPKPPN